VHNSLLFYNALLDKKINASIHIFPQGGHGIRPDDNPGSTELWMNLLELWLKESGFALLCLLNSKREKNNFNSHDLLDANINGATKDHCSKRW